MFASLYFGMFVFFNTVLFPGYVTQAYNLDHLLGIMPFGIPIEEFLQAWAFGSLWAPLYEDLKGYAIKEK